MKVFFNWIVKDLIAGGSQPGLYNEIDDDLNILKYKGVTAIVTLTEKPLPFVQENTTFKTIHFPIPERGIPSPKKALDLCNLIFKMLSKNEKVFIHCKAGFGRTGTILACCLVNMGRTDAEAIKEIRSINIFYVKNTIQENFIKHYYDFYTREKILSFLFNSY